VLALKIVSIITDSKQPLFMSSIVSSSSSPLSPPKSPLSSSPLLSLLSLLYPLPLPSSPSSSSSLSSSWLSSTMSSLSSSSLSSSSSSSLPPSSSPSPPLRNHPFSSHLKHTHLKHIQVDKTLTFTCNIYFVFTLLYTTVLVPKKLSTITGSNQSLFLSYLALSLSSSLTSTPSSWSLSSLSSSSPPPSPSSSSSPSSQTPSLSSWLSSPPSSLSSPSPYRHYSSHLEHTHLKNIQEENTFTFIFRIYLRYSKEYNHNPGTVSTQPAWNFKVLKNKVPKSEVGLNGKFEGVFKIKQFLFNKRRAG